MHETLLFQSATDAAQAVRRKEISSRELTELLLARIDVANSAVNAVVELQRDVALQEAAAADEASARGEDVGPLHGVPMTIKDSFNVSGLHTTWGNPPETRVGGLWLKRRSRVRAPSVTLLRK
jgi:amidase